MNNELSWKQPYCKEHHSKWNLREIKLEAPKFQNCKHFHSALSKVNGGILGPKVPNTQVLPLKKQSSPERIQTAGAMVALLRKLATLV